MTRTRIITGSILLSILLPLTFIGGLPFALFGVLLTGLAANEMADMYSNKNELRLTARIFMIVSALVAYAQFAFIVDAGNLASISTYVLATVLLVTAFSLLMFVADSNLDGSDAAKFAFVSIYVGFGFGTMVLLREVDYIADEFPALVIYALGIAFLADIFAYVFGRLLGKHKMSPVISPKKTWEGFFGGLVVATILATIFAYHFDILSTIASETTNLSDTLNIVILILISITLVIISVVGDLAASKLKRHYEIKDFAGYLPGHGGILDRFDSTILVSLTFVGLLLVIVNIL